MTIVAVIGEEVGDTIALIDLSDPEQGKVKEVLWKQGKGLEVKPSSPVYSSITRRCVFVGDEAAKGEGTLFVPAGQAWLAEAAGAARVRQDDPGSLVLP